MNVELPKSRHPHDVFVLPDTWAWDEYDMLVVDEMAEHAAETAPLIAAYTCDSVSLGEENRGRA